MSDEITRIGNPRKPQGKEGEQMLSRMNESHSEVTDWALQYFDFQKNDRVIDIGCGGGATLKKMSQQIEEGHLTGVDYSEVSVHSSTEFNKEEIEKGNMEIIEASVEQLPFKDDTFDKAVTVESFYFWPDPVNNLKEVYRILKRGGTFLLVADIYQKEGLDPHAVENVKEYQLFNPTREEFQSMFLQAGFPCVKIHTMEGKDWICVEGVKGR